MPERFSPAERRAIMARVKGADTSTERAVRAMLRRLGARYRGQSVRLPGKPDFILPDLRVAIFVHGCFWHQHTCRRGRLRPASNVAYWTRKLTRNVTRDRRSARALRALGWRVCTIWECRLARHGERQLALMIRRARAITMKN